MKVKKKVLVLLALVVVLSQTGIISRAADYSDTFFSFCCQQASHDTSKRVKQVVGYVYCYPESGQTKMNVQVRNSTNSTVGVVKELNTGTRYALKNNVPAGNSIYLHISRKSKDYTINKGYWSPDCAGSYTVKQAG